MTERAGVWHRVNEASLPLLAGVAAALIAANLAPASYRAWVDAPWVQWRVLGHALSLRFLVNDGFMVLFFALAADELAAALRQGGALHPFKQAANPLLASAGGVLVPAVVYWGLTELWIAPGVERQAMLSGWAIPTATDIALAWVAARTLFGGKHPAVTFLLLLAIADDILGMGIVALAYPSVHGGRVEVGGLLLGLAGLVAWGLRRWRVRHWIVYLVGPGAIAWWGMLHTAVHPALAMVPVVPFMAGAPSSRKGHDVADSFELAIKPVVDTGLFAFGLVNGGVAFGSALPVTWIVLGSLVGGKWLGVVGASLAARSLGLPLPLGMSRRDLYLCGLLAGIGLTVALFVASEAFPGDSPYRDAARLGALLSTSVGLVAIVGRRRRRAGRLVRS